jgi:hypothetical protein
MPQDRHGLREHLVRLADVLEKHGDKSLAPVARTAAAATDQELDAFLVSNDLWGGPGSIADQAGMPDGKRTPGTREIEAALIQLGRQQVSAGKVNPRTAGWVATFEKWAASGI